MTDKRTAAAVSTPPGRGGIAVIRMSGEGAFEIADRVYLAYNGKKVSEMAGYTCSYGYVKNEEGEKIDSCVLTVFRAPHSYTGEDTVEISCHGGVYVAKEVLRTLLSAGAVLAEAGEFTKTAFLNGKMSLAEAEGVMDIISSAGAAELKIANMERSGRAFKAIAAIEDRLTETLGRLSVWADYPEDDIPEVTEESLGQDLEDIYSKMAETDRTYDFGKRVREGIPSVIIGKPNAGKSTFFNYLVGSERSIVTDIAGTTRDIVEETVRIGEVTLRLNDTAGLRDTEDRIERIGIENVYKKLEEADLVLWLIDGSKPFSMEEMDIPTEKLAEKTVVAVINKSDISTGEEIRVPEEITGYTVTVSSVEGRGFDELEKLLKTLFYGGEIREDHGWISNERQRLCLKNSMRAVENARDCLMSGETFDIITVLLDEALEWLLRLEGRSITDEVVNEVFSKFCVGK